jgi:TolB-like protein/DNA-binding winged helix-turn-helix (wHTH) protein
LFKRYFPSHLRRNPENFPKKDGNKSEITRKLKIFMAVSLKTSYLLGEFEIEPGNRRLLRDGEQIHLTKKPFGVLLYLIENRDRMVSRKELLDVFWDGHEVYEETLTKCVGAIRKAFGETKEQQQFIQTHWAEGYRFIYPVEEKQSGFEIEKIRGVRITIEEESEPETKLEKPVLLPEKPARRNLLLILAWSAFIITAVFLSGWFWQKSKTTGAPIESIAVLPLKSLDAGENYLGLGIADAVIRRLSQTGKLTVRPTSAVRRYFNEETDALSAARELGTDAVLDGSIQRDGDRLRVSVNLLRVSDGVSLWADNFDMRTADIFTIQDTVAQQVASRLRLRLDPAQQARLSKHATTNLIAYEYYVRGVYSLDQRSFGEEAKPQMEATIDYFKKAIEADPDNALAHAQLANAYIWMANFIEGQAVWAERARKEINRAVALDPQLAETHVARHYLLGSAYEGWQTEAAVRELLLAQQLNPNVGHVELGSIYYHLGLEDLGDRAYQRALGIDPTSEHVKYMVHAHIRLVRKYDKWLDTYQKFNPNDTAPLPASYLMAKGRLEEAQKELDELSVKYPNDPNVGLNKALLSALKGDFRTAEAEIPSILSKLNPQAFNYHHATYDLACIYALTGKSDEAVKWLRKTAAEGFPSYTLFERDSYLNRIRQAPEFILFMEEMKAQNERYKSEFE